VQQMLQCSIGRWGWLVKENLCAAQKIQGEMEKKVGLAGEYLYIINKNNRIEG
jgi:hypothetical protein